MHDPDPYPLNVYERDVDGWSEAVWSGTQAGKTISGAPEWSLDTWRSTEMMAAGIDIQVFEYRHGDRLFGFQLAGEIKNVELTE